VGFGHALTVELNRRCLHEVAHGSSAFACKQASRQ
jgi:hypothetical protein